MLYVTGSSELPQTAASAQANYYWTNNTKQSCSTTSSLDRWLSFLHPTQPALQFPDPESLIQSDELIPNPGSSE
jgi:hypothetical protein